MLNDLFCHQAGVQEHRDPAELLDRKKSKDPVDGIGPVDCHMAPLPDSQAAEVRCDDLRTFFNLGPCEGRVHALNLNRIRKCFCFLPQKILERKVAVGTHLLLRF